jgi:hypothetical protein
MSRGPRLYLPPNCPERSKGKLMDQLMSFSRPMQWYHSHADLIWPDGPFKDKFPEDSKEEPFCGYKKEDMSRSAPETS